MPMYFTHQAIYSISPVASRDNVGHEPEFSRDEFFADNVCMFTLPDVFRATHEQLLMH